jgi:hypothetical protein
MPYRVNATGETGFQADLPDERIYAFRDFLVDWR